MEGLRPTCTQRLSYLACAMALVLALSLYKSSITAKPLSVAQRHWEAIATADPELLVSRYSDNAVLERSYAVADMDKTYQGSSIYSAWREFFEQYQIKEFRVVEKKQRDRAVEAEIQITAKANAGSIVTLSISYEVLFDRAGKIIKEVWQAHPEVSV